MKSWLISWIALAILCQFVQGAALVQEELLQNIQCDESVKKQALIEDSNGLIEQQCNTSNKSPDLDLLCWTLHYNLQDLCQDGIKGVKSDIPEEVPNLK